MGESAKNANAEAMRTIAIAKLVNAIAALKGLLEISARSVMLPIITSPILGTMGHVIVCIILVLCFAAWINQS